LKTNYVLIDYENVQVKSLSLLRGDHFHVRVFLGPSNNKLPVDLVTAMQSLGSRGGYVVLETPGSNALDFHLAYYLGVLASSDPSAFFHVISKDTGFDPLVRHLKANDILAARSCSIEEMPCFNPVSASLTPSNVVEIRQSTEKTTPSIQELVGIVIVDLVKRNTSRPSSEKTLFNTIHATCGKDMPRSHIESVVKELKKQGYVTINAGRVGYVLPEAATWNQR
jgi:hypothetical protein